MKNFEAINLYEFLGGAGASLKMNYKTRLLMKKNINALQEFYRRFAELQVENNQPIEALDAYEAEVLEKGSVFLEKDEDGNVINDNGRVPILPGKIEEVQELRDSILDSNEEYQKAVEEKEKRDEEWRELLDTEIDFELVKVPIEGFEDIKLDNFGWTRLELILEEDEE